MDIQQYIQKKKKDIQMNLLNYLDNEEEENYVILMKSLQDLAIEEDKNELKSILLLTSSIVQNHHRSKDVFKKNRQNSFKLYISNQKAFYKSPNIWYFVKFSIPSTTQSIGKGCFAEFNSLQEIEIPSSIFKISNA